MASFFCLSVTLLDAAFHGRRDDGVPEWPPSPLRAFQALVAASAARWREPQFGTCAAPALEWLEGLGPPDILAPVGRTALFPYRLYVPNNAGDILAKAWAAGNTEASIAAHRTEKDVRPTRLLGGDAFAGGNTLRFLWRLPVAMSSLVKDYSTRLSDAARSLTHLGWGIDMAAGYASLIGEQEVSELLAKMRLERWTPAADGTPLRVPQPEVDGIPGTFRSLAQRHDAFTRRMTGGKPQDVPPLSAFRVVGYRRVTDAPALPYVGFKLLHPVLERSAWFSPTHANCVAAMTRHATAIAAKQQPQDWVDSYVHGHRLGGEDSKPRFSYLPLPTIEHRRAGGLVVGGIRRVMLAELIETSESRLTWARQMLPGQFLIDEKIGDKKAMLAALSDSDWVLRQYTDASDIWSTVTPVVLPGSDEGKFAKAEKLFFKALGHAGYSPEALAEMEFRNVSFWPGGDLALRFHRPDYLKKDYWTVYHVRLRWKQPMKGPFAIGAGRHCGLGIFAAMRED